MIRALLVAGWLFSLAGTAGCLEVTPGNPVPAYSLVRVTLGEGERAWVIGSDLMPVDVAKTDFGLVFTGKPGRYAVLAFTAETQDQAIVEIGGANPGPGPDPPGPTPGDRWNIVVFYDSATLDNLTRDQQAIIRGESVKTKLEDEGHKLLQRVQGHPSSYPTSIRQYVTAVVGQPLPRVAIQSTEGGTVLHFPLPATLQAFLNTLNDPYLKQRAKR